MARRRAREQAEQAPPPPPPSADSPEVPSGATCADTSMKDFPVPPGDRRAATATESAAKAEPSAQDEVPAGREHLPALGIGCDVAVPHGRHRRSGPVDAVVEWDLLDLAVRLAAAEREQQREQQREQRGVSQTVDREHDARDECEADEAKQRPETNALRACGRASSAGARGRPEGCCRTGPHRVPGPRVARPRQEPGRADRNGGPGRRCAGTVR